MSEKEPEKSSSMWKERFTRHIPILKWISSYKKGDLLADTIAGVTVGLTLIPQSVAYAGLAGVPGEYGLYSSFMGSFMYVFFGTVKQVSVGPTSLLGLLVLEFAKDLPLEFVFLLTFLSGCMEFLLAVLQFGFLVNFISVPVTTSFQSATALIIVSSQIKDLLGLPKFKTGRFVNNIWNVSQRIQEAKLGDVILGIFCCIFLLSLRKLNDLNVDNKRLKKGLWFISISRNAICVFLCCVLGYYFSKNGECPFKLSGTIPSGLPPLRPPSFRLQIGNETLTFLETMYEAGPAVIVLPLIAVLANVTIAKAFSTGNPVDATQEMIALGMCNITGAFVGSIPTCGAFTRSAVSNSSGVRTPLAGLFTGSLIVLVILFLTPYFYFIPKATLASVLICAVIFMIDWKTILLLWKINKRDFLSAIITFVVCLIFGIQYGLLIGVAVNILHLLYFWARPSIPIQVKSLRSGKYYSIQPDIGLFFPATDFIRNEITRECVLSIPVVIDCLYFKGIDYTTARGIKGLENCCKKKGQKLFFINSNFEMYRLLKNSNISLSLKQCTDDEELNDILFHSGEINSFVAILVNETDFTEKLEKSLEKSLL